MNDSLNDGRSRIIDVPVPQTHSNVKRRRKNHNEGGRQQNRQSNMKTEDAKQLPIEMTPVLEAVKEYARRTHSLGALQGACALEKLAKQIRSIMPQTSAMSALAQEADAEAKTLKEFVKRVYEDA